MTPETSLQGIVQAMWEAHEVWRQEVLHKTLPG